MSFFIKIAEIFFIIKIILNYYKKFFNDSYKNFLRFINFDYFMLNELF